MQLSRNISLLIASLILSSCMSATGPSGEKLVMVGTNMGFTTGTIRESASKSGGIPLLGGSYGNDILHDPKEAAQVSRITVGAISVEGVIDQGTPTNQSLSWVWRITRTIITGQVFKTGIKEYANTQNLKTGADVAKTTAKLDADVITNQTNARAELIPKVNPEMIPVEAIKSP